MYSSIKTASLVKYLYKSKKYFGFISGIMLLVFSLYNIIIYLKRL